MLVWLCDHFSEQRKAQLGRLMRINFLLERDRLSDYTRNFPPDDRLKARRQLEHGRDNLTRTLVESLREVYGLAEPKEDTRGAEVPDGRHVLSLQPQFPRPQPEGSKPFDQAVAQLADGLLSALYDKHPDFGPGQGSTPRAVTQGELATALKWLTRAMDEGGRAEVDPKDLRPVKRVLEPLELGTVHDGPLVVKGDQWRTRINQAAAAHGEHGELSVEDIRNWIRDDLGLRGLDKHVSSLLIAAYALFDDRSWALYSGTETSPPPLSEIGLGWKLRAQQLPTAEEYSTARDRAGTLFGVVGKPGLFARNVGGSPPTSWPGRPRTRGTWTGCAPRCGGTPRSSGSTGRRPGKPRRRASPCCARPPPSWPASCVTPTTPQDWCPSWPRPPTRRPRGTCPTPWTAPPPYSPRWTAPTGGCCPACAV